VLKIVSIRYRDNSVIVRCDSGEEFSVLPDFISSRGLAPSLELDLDGEEALRCAAELWLCRRKALGYLALRSRSEKEMSDYLRKRGFSTESIERTTGFLREKSYLDDAAFARDYIERTLGKKTVGRRRIESDLYRKGIDRHLVARELKEAGDVLAGAEFEKGLVLAGKKLASLEGKSNSPQSLYMYLVRRGFSGAVIKKILKELGRKNVPDE
jgi:regulatory protein